MAEIRRGGDAGGGDGGTRPSFGDRLPWLEPVEDQDGDDYYAGGGGYGGVMLAGVAVLILIALLTAAVLWFRHRHAATADVGQIIHAEAGPYKQKPQDAGGMKADTSEQVAGATGAGQDVDAPLDAAAMPEASIVGPREPAKPPAPQIPAAPKSPPAAVVAQQPPAAALPPPAPRPVAPPVVAAPPRAIVADTPAPAGGAIQLGAFSSEAKARTAWKGISGRFDFLKDMTPIYAPVTTPGGTLYRLRATGGTAGSPASICGRLKLAGDTCAVIGG